MIRHAEYSAAQMDQLTTAYQWVFHSERNYLIDLYFNQKVISTRLFNSLYREVDTAEMMVLDYSFRQ
ncbi:hypothetical protein [Levilactobacillus brevis]|nr:hypothetical protein [Levilactobacillus brevis]AJA81098.1 hypothetical protein L747_09090 [Levilactobacillus brevis BSO 464]KIO94814.1 hypothetical protein N624_0928 [Levilactobacillus brevis]KIO97091.1 hypothetical protein N627_2063 [Levilactobacillus brevis]